MRGSGLIIRCGMAWALLAGAAAAAGQAPAGSAQGAAPTLFDDVMVFDGERMTGPVDVLTRAGRIEMVAAEVRAPAGAEVVDGAGRTLLPGLIDAHTHAFGDALREALVFGVTTELDMFTEPGFAAAMRAQQEAGNVAERADLFSAGVLATAPGGHGTEYGFAIPTITDVDSAASFVAARFAEGSDYLKIVYDDGALFGLSWPTVSRDLMRALIEAAHAHDRLAVVHVSTARAAFEALDAGADGLVHLFTDETPTDELIELARGRGAFVIPTMVVLKSITGIGGGAPLVDDPRIDPYLAPASRAGLSRAFPARGDAAARFAIPRETVRRLHAAGVAVLAGTDAPNPGTSHGAAMHRELELLVDAGLSPLDALRSATSLPAGHFGLADRGRIAVGMRADLLLVRGDPSADITVTRAIEGVWKGGVRADRAGWAARVAAERAAAGRAPAGLEAGLISDFEGGGAATRFGTAWTENTDGFAGGTSTVSHAIIGGGANDSRHALRISGTITNAVAYAWAGLMWSPGAQHMMPANLSTVSGLRFSARGDGRTHRVLVFAQNRGTAPIVHEFSPGEEWATYTVPWSALGIDGSDVMAIMFVGAPPAGEFWLEVDDVELR